MLWFVKPLQAQRSPCPAAVHTIMLNAYGGYLPNNTIDTVSGGQAQFLYGNRRRPGLARRQLPPVSHHGVTCSHAHLSSGQIQALRAMSATYLRHWGLNRLP